MCIHACGMSLYDVCAGVYVSECRCACAAAHVLRPEDNLQCWSLPSHLFGTGSLSCCLLIACLYIRLAGPWISEDSFVSASHLTIGALGLQTCVSMYS